MCLFPENYVPPVAINKLTLNESAIKVTVWTCKKFNEFSINLTVHGKTNEPLLYNPGSLSRCGDFNWHSLQGLPSSRLLFWEGIRFHKVGLFQQN